MTRKLETLFNLPTASEDTNEIDLDKASDLIEENRELITEVDSAIDKIDLALPSVRSLDTADNELDELAKLAKDRAEDLIDLGMNVDPRFAGVILQTASTLLGHSITAKTAKIDKKLKMVQLQLAKAKLDHQIAKDNNNGVDVTETQGIVLDRNELLKNILAGQKPKTE